MQPSNVIEPDHDLRQWSELYALASESGKSLRQVRVERASNAPRLPNYETGEDQRVAWLKRQINGSWMS